MVVSKSSQRSTAFRDTHIQEASRAISRNMSDRVDKIFTETSVGPEDPPAKTGKAIAELTRIPTSERKPKVLAAEESSLPEVSHVCFHVSVW